MIDIINWWNWSCTLLSYQVM